MKHRSDWIAICCALVVLGAGVSRAQGQAAGFDLFAVTDLVRVFEDGYHLPVAERTDVVSVFGMRGEDVSAQAVIHARDELEEVAVELGPLSLDDGSDMLPLDALTWHFVGTIPLNENAPNQRRGAFVREAPARYPDYLMDDDRIAMRPGEHRSVWLTIRIPTAAAAGVYAGAVTVNTSAGSRSIPLYVRIYPLTLPEERHLKVTEWHSTGRFAEFHGIEEPYSEEGLRMLKVYAENMAAHRQNMFRVGMNTISIARDERGELSFDFSLFDRIAEDVVWSTPGMDYLETGFLARFGEGGWSSTEILLRDFEVADAGSGEAVTLPGKEVIPPLLAAFQKHLEEKGWLEKTYFHVQDEPTAHNAMSYRDVSAFMHEHAPGLIRMDAIETALILDDLEVAVPKLDHLGSWYDTYRDALIVGTMDELWFYTVGIYQGSGFPNKTIDLPLMDNRILHWLNYRYDATGFLHWGFNQWTPDPFNEVGQHLGDGWHVYPKEDGLLNSLRWEQMRNGIQDYEYFRLLEDRTRALRDSLGARFDWIRPDRRGKEIIAQVVTSLSDYRLDPALLYRAKRQVIDELLSMDTSPRLFVQTDPSENTTLQNRSMIEVAGWVEPGSTIVVSGQTLPVSDDGLFMERFTVSPESNIITITASNSHGSKTLTRHYEVTY